MDDVTKAKLQLQLVLVTYRQHVRRHRGDGDGAAAFRERARPILGRVHQAFGSDREVAELLAEARRELGVPD